MWLLESIDYVNEPTALFSLHLSDIMMDLEDDMSFAEIMTYMLYHALVRMYYVSADGRYCVDSIKLDMLVAHLRKLCGKSSEKMYPYIFNVFIKLTCVMPPTSKSALMG